MRKFEHKSVQVSAFVDRESEEIQMHGPSEGLRAFIFMGGSYGLIFLVWALVYVVKREWEGMRSILLVAALVEAIVGLVCAMVAWPTLGFIVAVPCLIAGFVLYIRSECQRTRTTFGH